MAAAKCPECGLTLRGLPESRRVLATCPTGKGGCGAKFYHPPTERSVILFRCAHDGRGFTASFKRETGQRKFSIDRMAVTKPGATAEGPEAESRAYNIDVYDFTGFYCPCCGVSSETPAHGAFVKCGQCKELVCEGLTYDQLDENGKAVRLHVCHSGCGYQGIIRPTLGEVHASRHTTTERAPVARLAGNPNPPPLKIGKG